MVGNKPNNEISEIAILPDDKILAVGDFNTFDGKPVGRIIRLNKDGFIDETFNTGAGANLRISRARVLKDGKILIRWSV